MNWTNEKKKSAETQNMQIPTWEGQISFYMIFPCSFAFLKF